MYLLGTPNHVVSPFYRKKIEKSNLERAYGIFLVGLNKKTLGLQDIFQVT